MQPAAELLQRCGTPLELLSQGQQQQQHVGQQEDGELDGGWEEPVGEQSGVQTGGGEEKKGCKIWLTKQSVRMPTLLTQYTKAPWLIYFSEEHRWLTKGQNNQRVDLKLHQLHFVQWLQVWQKKLRGSHSD